MRLFTFTTIATLIAQSSYGQSNVPIDVTAYTSFSGQSFGLGVTLSPETHKSGFSLGIDIGTDGKAVDNTHGSTENVRNVVFFPTTGAQIRLNDRSTILMMAMFGARHISHNCPSGDSFLGFRCYADIDHETEYEAVIGFLTTFSYRGFLAGAKMKTGGARKIILGYRF